MLPAVTRSGYVMSMATSSGTPTAYSGRLGSGEMTVRAEKSTRLPLRLPRKRPCLPLRRWHSPRMGRLDLTAGGSPGRSPLMSAATCTCRKSQFSATILDDAPLASASRSDVFMEMISCSLTVRSSSLEPPPASMGTDGRIATGGTSRCVRMRFSGRPACGSSHSRSQSSSGMARSSSSARSGVRSSAARATCGATSGASACTPSRPPSNASRISALVSSLRQSRP